MTMPVLTGYAGDPAGELAEWRRVIASLQAEPPSSEVERRLFEAGKRAFHLETVLRDLKRNPAEPE